MSTRNFDFRPKKFGLFVESEPDFKEKKRDDLQFYLIKYIFNRYCA